MRILILSLAMCLGLGQAAISQGQSSTDGRNVQGWEAVGRLNIAGLNMCTGALIAPNMVLTAAHCLFDQKTGKRIDATKIVFQAGLDGTTAKASRKVMRAVVHSDYRFRLKGKAQIGYDLAVLRLRRPISTDQIMPFQTDDRPERGDPVSVISYTIDQATTPSLEEPCYVLARQFESLIMSCSVEFGASGSPVFVALGGQRPRLVSVVTAKAMMGNRPVSIATVLDIALKKLIKQAG